MGGKSSKPHEPLNEEIGEACGNVSPSSSLTHPLPVVSSTEQAVIDRAEDFRKKFATDDPEGAAAVEKLISMLKEAPMRGTASASSARSSLASGSKPEKRSAHTAPSKWQNSGAFVHGTKFNHFQSILKEGLKASKSEIFMIDELRSDGRVPGLEEPPELLIFIDEDKARSHSMYFEYDPREGTWRTKGIDGVIRPWFFQRVIDQRKGTRGNVLFQSKDDPTMAIALKRPPKRLLHATYWENVSSILHEGIQPAKNPLSENRRAFGDLLRGAEDHVYVVDPRLARGITPKEQLLREGLQVVGLERKADALLEIDIARAGKSLEVVQSAEREETMYIKGAVPPEAIVGMVANEPLDLPEHLTAKIVDPKCFEDIPIIDLSKEETEVLKGLKYACEVVGFMQVVGHGISEELQERHLRIQKQFFSLSREQKLELETNDVSPVRGFFGKGGENLDGVKGAGVDGTVPKKTVVDNKEGLDLNGVPWSKPGDTFLPHIFGLPSRLPSEELVPGFREMLAEYQDEMFKLTKRLLRLMAIILEQPEDFFEAHITHPVATHRLLHYWPIKDFKREIGVGPHTDYGLLTILKQDQIGGLQVLNAKDMQWVHAMPIPNAFVINIGDMLARWTAHRFKSTVHRVVNISPAERYSSPYFFEPNLDTIIATGGLCDGPEKSKEELTGEVILDRFYTGAGMLQDKHRQAYAERQLAAQGGT